jgi:hypothetical protein
VKQSKLQSDVAAQSSLRRDKPAGGGRLHGNRLNDQFSSVALEETPNIHTCNSVESGIFQHISEFRLRMAQLQRALAWKYVISLADAAGY